MRAAGRTLYLELDGDSTRTRLRSPIHSDTSTTIRASRGALLGSRSCGGQTYPNYALAGSQMVEIEELPDPEVIATETVLPQADTVEFIAVNIPRGLAPAWWYRTGDTLSTPAGGSTNSIAACAGQTSCRYRVTHGGRMYVRYSNGLAGLAYYASEIVWVGKTPQYRLKLACDPARIPQGGTSTCTATTDPAGGPIDIKAWRFNSAAGLGQDSGDICAPASNPCYAAVPEDGTVYVTATVSQLVQVAAAYIDVEAWIDEPGVCTSSVASTTMMRLAADCAEPDSTMAVMTCGQVTRGEPVACTLSNLTLTDSVAGWWFSGSGMSAYSDSSYATWEGIGVQSGIVRARILDAGGQKIVSDSLVVLRRDTMRWDSQSWHYDAAVGVCPLSPLMVDTVVFAINHMKDECSGRVVRPRLAEAASLNTYESATVIGGPNNALWYVTEAYFHIWRESTISPNLNPGGRKYLVTDTAQVNKCRANMSLPGPTDSISVTWYAYNTVCEGQSTAYINGFRDGILAHEGYGTTGTNGHQSRIEMAATLETGDARWNVEWLVGPDAVILHKQVTTAIAAVELFLYTASDVPNPHQYVRNNWSGNLWWLDHETIQRFVERLVAI